MGLPSSGVRSGRPFRRNLKFLTLCVFDLFLRYEKLKLRGRDPSRKIRSEILRRTPPRMPRDLCGDPVREEFGSDGVPGLARTLFSGGTNKE